MKTSMGPLCQIEIHVSDVQRSLAFYEDVFGWRAVPAEIHNYIVLEVPADSPYGVALVPTTSTASLKNNLVLYFSCDNPDSCLEKVSKAGGRIRFRAKQLPGYGRVDQFEDPDGQRFGLYLRA